MNPSGKPRARSARMDGAASAVFPFSALVGQDDLRLALEANAVNPAIDGVLIRGQRGTAKSTAVRAIARLLGEIEVVAGCPYSCDPAAPDPDCPAGPHPAGAPSERRGVRLVELPVGASTDRLAGSLDIERALVEGVKAFEPGLLAAAHRGVLYVDEVNLLADHLVDMLLDAAALSVNYVERDSISVRHAARFLLVGTMNPEEGDLRPQLLDRFGLGVEVRATAEVGERAEIVRRRLAFERDRAGFAARFAAADEAVGERIRAARERLPSVSLPEAMVERIAAACAALGVDGLRADIVIAKTALALAALDGADEVGAEHVRRAALLAIPHRRRGGPLDEPGLDPAELDRALDGAGEGPPENDGPPPSGGGNSPRPQPATAPGEATSGDGAGRAAPQPAPAAERVDRPAGSLAAPPIEAPGTGSGPWGRRSRATTPAGRPVGDRPLAGGDLAPLATLRAAAPHQRTRGRQGPGLKLRRGDLRSHVREGRESNLVLFVLDASGSMGARRRMALVKGAVRSLLLDAYRRRDRVGLVSFRGNRAEVPLPPTSSVEVGAARLAELATGGRTPLAAGLKMARALLRAERSRDPRRRPIVVVVTDGRANAGADAIAAAERAAARLAAEGATVVVLDSEDGAVRLGLARRIAAAAGGRALRLEELAGEDVAQLVRGLGAWPASRRRVA